VAALGLSNAHLEAWGPFGRGWANQHVNACMTSPDIVPLIVYAEAWTPGRNGLVSGKCVRVSIEEFREMARQTGRDERDLRIRRRREADHAPSVQTAKRR
jgi:carboxypeptidase Q